MKKKILLTFLTTLVMALGVASCNGENSSSTTTTNTKTETTTTTTTSVSSEDFTIITEDNGLSVENYFYNFACAKEGDVNAPKYTIKLNTDSTWDYCSSLNERVTKVIIQDTNVIPVDAISLELVLNSDIIGSSGSNEIDGINIVFNRKLLKPGSSKIKLQVKPDSGNSSICKLTTVCFEVYVEKYGTMDYLPITANISVNLDGLEEKINELSKNPTSVNFNISDTANLEEVYGYNADYNKQVEIDLNNIPQSIEINDFKFASTHTYNLNIFVEGKEVSDRIWFSLLTDGEEEYENYFLQEDVDNSFSSLQVFKEDITIKLKVGNYFTLN